MEHDPFYEGRNEIISSLLLPGKRKWNVALVRNQFLHVDAETILNTHIPQRVVVDRVVWASASNVIFTVKSAYHYWYDS